MPRPRLPADLRSAARRIAAWRRIRPKRWLPPELWEVARELSGRHGVSATARALGLDYYGLKRRVETPAAPGRPFVEIVPAPAPRTCVAELEDGRGRRMRVHLAGEDLVAHVEALARSFWGRRG